MRWRAIFSASIFSTIAPIAATLRKQAFQVVDPSI
ncbi:hypothetical protein NK6_5288 [Bradyrhizobium diazoefficiens]|uniref:Uncharacterized protein n=1 Tax=Bradyrhizobium diazoefficiens TaxID=1355477 RepID=A0A0E4FZ33_9BRAD|nr:hypothetical protein NK6_5288 [Bradyrhizobium diazoefficiens]